MSKIEKALKRARESGARDEHEATPPRTGSELVPRKTVSTDTPASSASTKLIPHMRQPYRLESEQRSLRKIIAPDAMDSPIVKSLRAVRTKLLQKAGGNNGVVMMVGAIPGSGTSFVAVNLATAFAFDAAKTSLLIDCNLRHPFLHNVLLKEAAHGLVDYLSGTEPDLAKVIQPTGIDRLRVIPVGMQVDPTAEYFTMERMRKLVADVRKRYPDRFVFLDCPPLASSADTQILMEFCDYVVVVVPYARASEARVESALKMVDARKFAGIIVNDDPRLPALDWRGEIETALKEQIDVVVSWFRRWTTSKRST